MNKKFLFGMLAGGALLAACTADDDLNVAKVAKDVNPSAPVFNVVFEDENVQNRADWVENSAKVNFKDGDLLSLFHGVARKDGTTDADPTYEAFFAFQNAIYEGASNGDGYTFSTKSMVYNGAAVLVWPADTTVAWRTEAKTGGPILKIDPKQDELTKEKTPYISEIMHIADYTGDSLNHEEGYGRKYDIIMKRIGGTLKLNIKKAAADKLPDHVAALEIASVSLNAGSGAAKFTTQIPVVIGANKPASYVETTSNGVTTINHPNWYKASDVDPSKVVDAGQAVQLTTTDVVDNESATYANFTVLPVK